MKVERLRFSYNWNNKLYCKMWTTIRLLNPKKYRVGCVYEVFLKNEFLGKAELTGIRKTKCADLNEFICGLDTGYSIGKTKQIINRMYKKENPKLMFLLFRWVQIETGCSIDLSKKLKEDKREVCGESNLFTEQNY